MEYGILDKIKDAKSGNNPKPEMIFRLIKRSIIPKATLLEKRTKHIGQIK